MVYLGLPIQNGGSFHGELLNNQMVVQTRTLPNSGDGLLFSIHGGNANDPCIPYDPMVPKESVLIQVNSLPKHMITHRKCP